MKWLPIGLLATTALTATAPLTTVMAAPIQTVFVVAMENHDFTQPSSYTAIQPIDGNAAAPYVNSLITPGNANAQYTSYFSNMTNVGTGVHPSEPNYIWQNAGSNFGVTTDADPSAAAHNIVSATSMTGLMSKHNVTWNAYQEDVQYSTAGTVSASGTGGTHNGNVVVANPYYGLTQFHYSVQQHPM